MGRIERALEGHRKDWAALVLSLLFTGATVMGAMSNQEWTSNLLIVAGGWVAGNVGEHWAKRR